jgi:deoxyribodipyrimidine photolyase-related protein
MASRARTLRLILGDKINDAHSWFKRTDDCVILVLMEMRQETDYVRHHIQKVAAFFAAMRALADHLKSQGHRINYLRRDDPQNRQTIRENILGLTQREGFTAFDHLLPDEYRLDLEMQHLAKLIPVTCSAQDTEHFLTERSTPRGSLRLVFRDLHRCHSVGGVTQHPRHEPARRRRHRRHQALCCCR